MKPVIERRTIKILISPKLHSKIAEYTNPLKDTVETAIWRIIREYEELLNAPHIGHKQQ